MTAKKNLTNDAKLTLLPPAVQDTIKEKAQMTTTDETPAAGGTTPTEEAPQAETATVAKPAKSKLTWKEKLALLPEDEAKALRAKAAAASRASKAKKRGTTPEQAAVNRLEARLAKIDQQLADLKTTRAELAAQLKDAKKALTTAEMTPTAGESVTSGTKDLD